MSISARAILLGLVAVALVVFIVSWAELVTGQIMIGFLQLPPVVLALLFLLVLVNRSLARWAQRWSLRPQELAVIHVMMLIAAMVSSRGLMEKLIPTLVGQNYYADSTNKWASLYFPFVKKWLVPWVPALGEKQWVAVRFFEGLRSWEHVPWLAWAVPLAAWSVPVVAMLFAYLCLATILRRQWTENERLSYPLAQLPLELIRERDDSSFLLNRLFWIGFLIPALLFTVNGLHNMFPAIPSVTTSVDVKQFLTQPPWNTVEYFVAYFSPAAVGFFFLLPTDLLFSLWFFFALGKVQEAGFASLGMVPESGPHAGARIPVAGQATGAWFALAIYLAFVSWPHLKRVWKAAVTGDRKESEGELLSYRTAVFGLFLAFAAVVVWTVAAGMSPWLALFEFGVFLFVQALIMARSTAEAGMLMTEGTFTPLDLVSAGIARSSLGGANLATFAFLDAMFTRDLRGLMLTGFLDGQRVADGAGLQRRKLLGVFALAVVTSILLAGALQLWLPYHRGAINMYSYTYRGNDIQFFRENAPALQGPVPIRLDYPGWIAGGMAVTAFLGWMRMRYFWFPLHPLGYALATTWTVLVFWCPILVAWICKATISRYGGMRAYQRPAVLPGHGLRRVHHRRRLDADRHGDQRPGARLPLAVTDQPVGSARVSPAGSQCGGEGVPQSTRSRLARCTPDLAGVPPPGGRRPYARSPPPRRLTVGAPASRRPASLKALARASSIAPPTLPECRRQAVAVRTLAFLRIAGKPSGQEACGAGRRTAALRLSRG